MLGTSTFATHVQKSTAILLASTAVAFWFELDMDGSSQRSSDSDAVIRASSPRATPAVSGPPRTSSPHVCGCLSNSPYLAAGATWQQVKSKKGTHVPREVHIRRFYFLNLNKRIVLWTDNLQMPLCGCVPDMNVAFQL